MLFIALIALQLIVFAILVAFLRVVIARNITTATSHLNELNQDYLRKLEEAKKRVAEADKYYDETILKTKSEAEKTKVQVLKEAHEEQEAVLKDSRRQGEEIVTQANRTAESLMGEIDRSVGEKAAEKACELVQQLLSQEVTSQIHSHWVDALSQNGLEELQRLKLPEDVREARVVSAHPLTPEQKQQLQRRVKERLQKEVHLSETVDPGLIAGLKIVLGNVVIDGSLQSKIKELTKHGHRGSRP